MKRRAAAGAPGAFAWQRGLRLAGVPLWLDAPRVHAPVVASHPLVAAGLQASRVIATPVTLTLARALAPRRRRREGVALPTPYRQPFLLGPVRLELFPNGYLPGSASCRLEVGGRRLVYAGPLGASPLAEPREVRRAEVVALCVAPRELALPPRHLAEEAAARWVGETVAAGETPVLVGPVLAVLPDVARRLADHPLVAHRQVVAAFRACRTLGMELPVVRRVRQPPGSGQVVLWPEGRPLARSLGPRERLRVALASPAASLGEAMPWDARFPVATEIDTDELVAYLQQCQAAEAVFVGGAPVGVRRAVAALGVRVTVLGPPRQMPLFAP